MTTAENGTTELRYDVGGMSCDHCRSAITSEVQRVVGVAGVDVDLDAHVVTVHGEELVDQVVREAITLAGYQPHLL